MLVSSGAGRPAEIKSFDGATRDELTSVLVSDPNFVGGVVVSASVGATTAVVNLPPTDGIYTLVADNGDAVVLLENGDEQFRTSGAGQRIFSGDCHLEQTSG